MKIHQIDKTGKRTGVTQEVPLKMWEKLQSQWGSKLRWQYDPPKPIKKKVVIAEPVTEIAIDPIEPEKVD